MKALSTRNDSPETASRPFDRDRDGFVLGDGGAMVVLESLEHAERAGRPHPGRGAGLRARAPTRTTSPRPAEHGEGAQRAMRACLADGKIDPKDVGYINAHGTSHPAGRRRRDRGGQGGVRRAGAQAGVRLDQVDDRAPARRRRRARVRRVAAGGHLRRHPADHQPVHARPRVRSRLAPRTTRSSGGWTWRCRTRSGSAATT